jgi:A/G-specific adenine glycosylase
LSASSGDASPAAAHLRAVQEAVLEGSPAHWRALPWRDTRDPWHILVSETMLQQTQAGRVVAPYLAFLDRFPTPAACAEAGPAEVLRYWHGLGYNRRALFLHRAALAMVERHGGAVPGDLAALLALPGIGPYTARAVLVFAFGVDVGVVDTNVARLLARAVAGRTLGAADAQALADRLVPAGTGWRFNQALFDLGAQVCTARVPDCASCSLSAVCAWATAGCPAPDPASGSAGTTRPQSRFAGSDRQGRGRLVAAMRGGAVAGPGRAATAGWGEEEDGQARARRVAEGLVADGLAVWEGDALRLP